MRSTRELLILLLVIGSVGLFVRAKTTGSTLSSSEMPAGSALAVDAIAEVPGMAEGSVADEPVYSMNGERIGYPCSAPPGCSLPGDFGVERVVEGVVTHIKGFPLEKNGVEILPRSPSLAECISVLGNPHLSNESPLWFLSATEALVLENGQLSLHIIDENTIVDSEGGGSHCPYCPLPNCPGGVLKLEPKGGHTHPCPHGCKPCPNDRGGLYAKSHGLYGE